MPANYPVVDNIQAWHEVFQTVRGHLLITHLTMLRDTRHNPEIVSEQQELLYHITPKIAFHEVMNCIAIRLNDTQGRRAFFKQLTETMETLKWVENKTPFLLRGSGELFDVDLVKIPKYKKDGNATIQYAVLLIFSRRLLMLADICERPDAYAQPLNSRAVYDWPFRSLEGVPYDSINLLEEIKTAHDGFIISYQKLLKTL